MTDLRKTLDQQAAIRRAAERTEGLHLRASGPMQLYDRLMQITTPWRNIEGLSKHPALVALESESKLSRHLQNLVGQNNLSISAFSTHAPPNIFSGQFFDIASIRHIRDTEALYTVPGATVTNRLAEDLSRASSPISTVIGDLNHSSILNVMAGLRSPWLEIGNEAVSTRALADLISMGGGLSSLRPFDPVLTDALRGGLGDWRDQITPTMEWRNEEVRQNLYMTQGLDKNLTRFTPEAFDEISSAARFSIPIDAEALLDEEGVRAERAFRFLRQLELDVRQFIATCLENWFGQDWMLKGLPPGMLDRWIEKRNIAIRNGQKECDLIQYSDFGDYRTIIEKKDNWRNNFVHYFLRIEDIRESLQRLHPVRIATMHARIISLDDELLLMFESRRILKIVRRQ